MLIRKTYLANVPQDSHKIVVFQVVRVDMMKCYLVHGYFSGGLDRQIAFNFNIIHVFIERYVFLKKT